MDLTQKIRNITVTTGIPSLGSVRRPLSQSEARAALPVFGFDLVQYRVHHLNVGISPIKYIDGSSIILKNTVREGGIKFAFLGSVAASLEYLSLQFIPYLSQANQDMVIPSPHCDIGAAVG